MSLSRFWLSYIARSLIRSGRRGVFAGLCVVVGVASVVALQSAGLTVRAALLSNVRAANGGDISVVANTAPLAARDLAVFRALQRSGRISSWTAVSTVHATAVDTKGRLVPFSVDLVSAPPYPLGGDPTFQAPVGGHLSSLLRGQGDVLVTSVLAQELGVGVGTRLHVGGIGAPGMDATVTGILSETSFEHSAAMIAPIADRSALGRSFPLYSAVYANVIGQAAPIAAQLRALFPTATVQTVAEAMQQAQTEVHDFQQFLVIVGLLALLIAGVGILNAMQSILARRRLEIAMLKTAGFGQGTLYALFGGEALLLGLLGGVVGTVLGSLAGAAITDALAGAEGIVVTYVIDTGILLGGVALGVGACAVFAVMPVVRAAGLRPLEVLREGTPERSAPLQTILLLLLVLALFVALTTVLVGDPTLALEFAGGAAVACLVLAGLFALAVRGIGRLGPARSRWSLPALGTLVVVTAVLVKRAPAVAAIVALGTVLYGATVLLAPARQLPLLIAARSLDRRRGRTSVTLVAFLAGVLSMTLTLTVALGLQSEISAALASNGSANLVAIGSSDSSAQILRAAHSLPGVRAHTATVTVQVVPLALDGRPVAPLNAGASATDAEGRFRSLNGVTGYFLGRGEIPSGMQLVAGRSLSAADAGTAHALVRSDLARPPYNLHLGSTMSLREPGSGVVKTLTVVGFYSRPRRRNRFTAFFTPAIYTDAGVASALGGPDAQSVVTFAVDAAQLSHDAAVLQASLPGVLVIDVGDLLAIVDTILSELLRLLAVITALVLGAGVAVVANGVALAMLERRREIALFKAVGFSSGSVQRFVLLEQALVGTLAGAVSVLATAVALAILSHVALQQAIGFDPVLAVFVLSVAAGLAVGTAYLAARGPIAVRPIEALRNE